ncbi:MAG TPA: hypothetical protein PK947_09545, partial [Ottowia sp.]|nr:hypothetical protein [Ottowia sp.]
FCIDSYQRPSVKRWGRKRLPISATFGVSWAQWRMLSDVTPFFSGFGGASQSPAIAQAFAHAALEPAGACKQPAAGVVDLAVSLTGPASLTPGTPASYLLRVANPAWWPAPRPR